MSNRPIEHDEAPAAHSPEQSAGAMLSREVWDEARIHQSCIESHKIPEPELVRMIHKPEFDGQGRLTAIESSLGTRTTLTYASENTAELSSYEQKDRNGNLTETGKKLPDGSWEIMRANPVTGRLEKVESDKITKVELGKDMTIDRIDSNGVNHQIDLRNNARLRFEADGELTAMESGDGRRRVEFSYDEQTHTMRIIRREEGVTVTTERQQDRPISNVMRHLMGAAAVSDSRRAQAVFGPHNRTEGDYKYIPNIELENRHAVNPSPIPYGQNPYDARRSER